jgi:medium-chain acyl-[acyl-carrier-protein] hydrolase
VTQHNKWFVCSQTKPKADSRIFFFPYAGGGPSVFSKWSAELPDNLEAQIAHYPGRGSRHNEPPVKSLSILIEELSRAIQPLLDKPFTFFGHSLGGLIAFELARYLHNKVLPQPIILFISACGAPQIPDPHPPLHALPESEFLHSLKELNGIPQEVLQNKEMLKLFLPTLRTDFEMVETYQYTPGAPLDFPISVFGGLDDERVSRERLEDWTVNTNSHFKSQYFSGDHFFINSEKGTVIESIIAEIALVATLPRNDG